MKYYVLYIWSDVEPELRGPFDTKELRDHAAVDLRQEDGENESGIYRLNVDDNGVPSIDSYGYLELNPEEDGK